MKTTRIIRIVACVVVLAYAASNVRADFTFGEPVNLGPTVNSTGGDLSCCVSYDGLELYFASNRGGGQGSSDLWASTRPTRDDNWGPPTNLGPLVNSSQTDLSPSISADGLELYFHANDRPGGFGGSNIWVTKRVTRDAPWGAAENLGPTVNAAGWVAYNPCIASDGLTLYFAWGGWVAVTRRATKDDPWETPVDLAEAVINSWVSQDTPWISKDARLLVFTDNNPYPPRPGGYGGTDIWCSRSMATGGSDDLLYNPHLWEPPVNLGPPVNTAYREDWSMISPDGSTLYFTSDRPGGLGGLDLWQASIDPILDLDGNGKVDNEDLLVLRAHWGQNYPPCDIGPFPWGDGIVDGEDLKVLLEYTAGTDADWAEPAINPPLNALDVSRDTILSWTSAGLGETHDVYFGTSLDDVTDADRDNPLGVLASRGQVETTYDPPGLLEFGTTYYWRIDEVGPAPDYTVYRWPVLDFTTELLAYPIESVIATSNAVSQAGTQPENTVNGSGLNGADEHSISTGDMWLVARSESGPTWIQYEFDSVYRLHEMWVWNYNSQFEMVLGIGLKDVTVEYSQNGTDWTALGDVQLAQATAKATYAHNTTVDFAGVAARYVRLIVHSGWGTLSSLYGLSEVRFLYVPTRSWKPQAADGATGVTLDATLRWHAGREAVLHEVYLSTNRQAVADGTAPVDTVTESSYRPDWLDPGQTYYWRINEINEAEDFSIWEGDVWEFRTIE